MDDIRCLSNIDDVRGLLGDCEERMELVYFAVLDKHASKVLDRGVNVGPKLFQITDLLMVLDNIQAVFLIRHYQLLIEHFVVFLSVDLQQVLLHSAQVLDLYEILYNVLHEEDEDVFLLHAFKQVDLE